MQWQQESTPQKIVRIYRDTGGLVGGKCFNYQKGYYFVKNVFGAGCRWHMAWLILLLEMHDQ
jgi:hypothetical protein